MKNELLAATAATFAIAFLGGAGIARADDTKQACIDASEKGQSLRDDHKLKAARAEFLLCARDACPGPVKRDCAEWLAGVDKAMPSVMIVAREKGQDVVKIGLDVDGKRVREELDGAPMQLDPGPHSIRLTLAGRPPVEQTLVVREGDKGRQIVIEFGAVGPTNDAVTPPPPEPSAGFHVPAPAWVLGGITVAAAGSFAVFGLMGKSDLSNLRDTCGKTQSCAQGDVDSAHTKLLVADISLYAGIATLAAAAVVTIIANKKSSTPPATGFSRPALTLRF